MRVGKCPICGGDTKEDIVEVQEIIEGEAYIIKTNGKIYYDWIPAIKLF